MASFFSFSGFAASILVATTIVGFFGERVLAATAEVRKFVRDHAEIFHGIGTTRRIRNIDQMRQHARALNVAQELDAQSRAQMRAFDQPWHVGDNKGLLLGLLADGDHAEIGFQRGEWIIGDLGPRGGDARDQRGLARVGIADEADVGEQLELQAECCAPRPRGPVRARAAPDACWWRSAGCRARRVRPWR